MFRLLIQGIDHYIKNLQLQGADQQGSNLPDNQLISLHYRVGHKETKKHPIVFVQNIHSGRQTNSR